MLSRGYLLAAFVPKSLLYIPDIDATPLTPIEITRGDVPPIIDVVESPAGEVYFATGTNIYRLRVPTHGDCNGDGLMDFADASALERELADGDPQVSTSAQKGLYAGTWGCDVDGNGLISGHDRAALWRLLTTRARPARGR